MQKKFLILLTALVTIFLLHTISYADISEKQLLEMYDNALKTNKTTFTDIDDVPWAVAPITELVSRGIVNGVGNGIFAPHKNVSRAEFIKLITSTCGLVNPDAQSSYSDVPDSHWSYIYVSSAKDIGLTDIYSATELNPDEPVSREDICYMSTKAIDFCIDIQNSEGQTDVVFDDESEISPYAVEPIYQLTQLNILNGRGDGTFAPKDSATRAESAKIIYNVLKIIEENY